MEWRVEDAPIAYPEAVAEMEGRVAAIRDGTAPELVWLLEHPPLYTAGTSADPAELLDSNGLPVFSTGRGGRYTYHGPGQRIAYVLLDLNRPNLGQNRRDVRCHVHRLEEWVIRTLARFNIKGERRDGRIGIWVLSSERREEKIAAIGVRVRRWVTYHGLAVNLDPDLARYRGIVPCGIAEHGVTSLAALGITATMPELDMALRASFAEVFEEFPSCGVRAEGAY
ncbi:MAG: lipoyl(octanoyl) transferase LipB [Alphaproteobacteria bacterium]|nr:lipoyl(octanoyl) transferase LipB [Alphaproteobacteria bacterium]